MLTVAQEVVIEIFAKQLIDRIGLAIRNKPINRTSVRYENGQRITTDFTSPVNATGKLLRSLRFEITETHLIIHGENYAYFLIYGRKPTQAKGKGTVKEEILKWIRAKNISSEISEKSLAFLISRKIHREGTSIYIKHKGQNSGLIDNILTKEIIDEFNRKFTAQLETELQAEFGN